MNSREANLIALDSGLMKCLPGDKFVSPRGQVYYQEPSIELIGCSAYAFMIKTQPVGVLIFRSGNPTQLRYCDREGRVHHQEIAGDGFDEQMMAGITRMAELTAAFLGERNPLARRMAANTLPA